MKGGKTLMNVFVLALIAYCLYKRRAAIPVLLKFIFYVCEAVYDAWVRLTKEYENRA